MTERFEQAIAAIDAEHAKDPRAADSGEPPELAYARRMTHWLERLYPNAPEPLRLAVRAQHIRRWEIRREDYEEGRDGYIRWRNHLKRHHARLTSEILENCGYGDETTTRVRDLLRKRGVKSDPDTQALEDAACLVFLETMLEDFAARHPKEKVASIVAKTWRKMSSRAQETALDLPAAEKLGAIMGADWQSRMPTD